MSTPVPTHDTPYCFYHEREWQPNLVLVNWTGSVNRRAARSVFVTTAKGADRFLRHPLIDTDVFYRPSEDSRFLCQLMKVMHAQTISGTNVLAELDRYDRHHGHYEDVAVSPLVLSNCSSNLNLDKDGHAHLRYRDATLTSPFSCCNGPNFESGPRFVVDITSIPTTDHPTKFAFSVTQNMTTDAKANQISEIAIDLYDGYDNNPMELSLRFEFNDELVCVSCETALVALQSFLSERVFPEEGDGGSGGGWTIAAIMQLSESYRPHLIHGDLLKSANVSKIVVDALGCMKVECGNDTSVEQLADQTHHLDIDE